jgi:hypothetical protein
MPDYSPFSEVFEAQDPGVAITTDDTFAFEAMPFAGKVTAVTYVPEAASTGDNTNKRTYTLVNKGASGSGTTVMATLDLVTGTDLVAFDEKAATISATAADLVFAAGDVLAWKSTHAGTGLVDPGGKVRVTVQRAQS